MYVHVNNITGIEDACVSLLMSKRSWTLEKDQDIRDTCRSLFNYQGFMTKSRNLSPVQEDGLKMLNNLFKWGVTNGHTTLLRFIDISITIEGLHRGGQDDLDSHAARMDNRIVRASTRLGKFATGEKSTWYDGKILSMGEVINLLGIEMPESIDHEDESYVLHEHGYVNVKNCDQQDTIRGLYNLAIPCNSIFKVQYPELCHIAQHRGAKSHAHPELKEVIRQIEDELWEKLPILAHFLHQLKMQP